jgi:hypothetical protein
MRRAVMAASGGLLLALVVTLAAGRVRAGANGPAASAVPVFVVEPIVAAAAAAGHGARHDRRARAAWGGPGARHPWPDSEHGIHRNDRDHVWLAGNGARDGTILKLTRDGEFVMKRPP